MFNLISLGHIKGGGMVNNEVLILESNLPFLDGYVESITIRSLGFISYSKI